MKNITKKLVAIICIMMIVIPFVTTSVSAAKVGAVVGYAQPTDIVATINGYQIESYNVDGSTYICVEDLRHYGFDVYYDDYSRSLYLDRNHSIYSIDPQNTNSKFWEIGSNNKRKSILYTDITTYVNGIEMISCNINGQTIINFNALVEFGTVEYDNDVREISLLIEDMYYNPVAIFADDLNENNPYNSDWKTIWRAKGDLMMFIATARTYANKTTVNEYVANKFPSDRADMYEIYNMMVSNGIPVSSVYIEVRNSDGTIIASHQI